MMADKDSQSKDPARLPVPPSGVKILRLEATPFTDLRRVRVELELIPFKEPPNVLINLADEQGKGVAELLVLSSIHASMEFTLHVSGGETLPARTWLSCEVFYETRQPPVDRKVIPVDIPHGE
jgi:hypothetical protein